MFIRLLLLVFLSNFKNLSSLLIEPQLYFLIYEFKDMQGM